MESLRSPHFLQLGLMQFGPLPDQAVGSGRKLAFDQVQRADLDHAAEFAIDGMEVRYSMLARVHSNDDPVKT